MSVSYRFVLDGVAIGVMGAWFGLSVLGQLPFRATQRLRLRDVGGLIPHWSFFAPKPGTVDFHLLYRDRLVDDTMTDWTEVSLCDSRRWWHGLWNPRKREKKVLFDLTVGLLKEAQVTKTDVLPFSIYYLILLTFLSSLPRLASTSATQFLLMVSYGVHSDRELEVLFTSAVHPL